MLEIGNPAPAFEGMDQDGNLVKMVDLLTQGEIVLYFYPKDNTPGCTAEACSLRNGYQTLKQQGFTVVGVSPDSAESHRKFITKQKLPFTLIVDTNHQIAEKYGTWGLKKFLGKEYMGIHRKTFVINQLGLIEKIFDKVNTKNHADQILNSYK